MTDVLTFGEAMASLRAAGPLRLGGALDLSVAGAEANVAIGLARLGHTVSWTGRVGRDELGALVLRTLRAEGVDLSHALVDPDAPTGLILFEPGIAQITNVLYYRSGSAGSRLAERQVEDALTGVRPKMLHLTGITPALGPGPRAAVESAAARAREAGITVSLDVNHRPRLWSAEEAASVLRPLAASVDIVIASDDELALVAPAGAAGVPGQITALHDLGVGEVAVKRGADGASAHTVGHSAELPARPVPVVDTVGAGDAFTAGYLSARLDGLDLAERLGRAVTAGAFAVASRGDWEGLPRRTDLALLDSVPGSTLR